MYPGCACWSTALNFLFVHHLPGVTRLIHGVFFLVHSSVAAAYTWWPHLAAAHSPAPQPNLKLSLLQTCRSSLYRDQDLRNWQDSLLGPPALPIMVTKTLLCEGKLCLFLGMESYPCSLYGGLPGMKAWLTAFACLFWTKWCLLSFSE